MTPRLTADERRVQLVDAAIEEFAQSGLKGASTEAIAKRAGISHAYVFRLYPTKRDLFLAAVDRCFDLTQETFAAAYEERDPDADVFHALGASYVEQIRDRSRLLFQLHAYAACGDEDIRARVRERYLGLMDWVQRGLGAVATTWSACSCPRACSSRSAPRSTRPTSRRTESTWRGRCSPDDVLERLARLATTRPRRVAVLAVVYLAVAAVLGGPVAGALTQSNDDFFDPDAESVAARQAIEQGSGLRSGAPVLVLVREPGDPAAIVREVRAVPGVATTAPPVRSRDGSATLIPIAVRADADSEDVGEVVQRALADAEGVTVGGLALAAPAIGEQVQEDLARAELLAFPLLFLLSLWVFRGVVAALMPLLVGLLTIMGTFLGLRLANEVTGLSIFALNISTALGLGLAVDYALFILARYREEVAGGASREEAIGITLRTAGRTVVFSSMTVAAAMLALLVFPQKFLYSMGLAGALTAVIAGAVSLLVLPSVLMLLGDRIDALSPRRRPPRQADDEDDPWYRLAWAVMRRPLPVALATSAALILLSLPFYTGVTFTGVDASVLPAGSTPRQVDTALRTEFPPGGADPVQVVVRGAAGDVEAWARRPRLPARRGGRGGAAGDDDRRLADRRAHGRAGARPGEPGARRADPRGGGSRAGDRRRRDRGVRGPAGRARRAAAARARHPRRHDARDPLRHDRVRRAAGEGAAHERAEHQRRVRPARARVPGRAPGGAARVHEPGCAGVDAAARAARGGVRAEHGLRRVPDHAHQGGA